MDAPYVPLVCYFGGNLSSTTSPEYVGGRSSASFISKSTTLSELCNQARVTCGLSEDTLIKLKCRYPLNHSMAIALDISDESSLTVALSTIPNLSSSLVVYIEEVSKQLEVPRHFEPSKPFELSKQMEVSKQSAALIPSTFEDVDKHITTVSPSDSRGARNPLKAGRGRDVGWLHCKPVGESTNKTQCNYCGKIMSGGGITRMKQHLAGGSDVEKCTQCGLEVRQMFRELLRKKQFKSGKRIKEQRYPDEGVSPESSEKDIGKEVLPLAHTQFPVGGATSCGRSHEEIALMEADSDD